MPSQPIWSAAGHQVEPGPDQVRPDKCLIAGFLLGHRGHTRTAYLADLRDFAEWCVAGGVELLAVDRADVEAYACDLEQAGRRGRRWPADW
jgi:hypothetical protein